MSSAHADTETERAADGERDGKVPAPEPDAPRTGAPSWYDVLEVEEAATHAEIQRAYDRALALVEGRSIGGYLMLDPIAAESARADVETAHAVLSNPDRRAAYDERLAARRGGSARERATEQRALHIAGDVTLASTVVPGATLGPAAANSVDTAVEVRDPPKGAAAAHEGAVRFEPPKTWPGDANDAAGGHPAAEQHSAATVAESGGTGPRVASAHAGDGSGIPVSTGQDAPGHSGTESHAGSAAAAGGESSRHSTADGRGIRFAPTLMPAAERPESSKHSSAAGRGIPAPKGQESSEHSSAAGRGIPASHDEPPAREQHRTSPPAPVTAPDAATIPVVPASSALGSGTGAGAEPSGEGRSNPAQLPAGEIDGPFIKALRESRGLTIDDVAFATKIRKPYLRAIEEQDLPNLPDRVYLRGFLTQVGRVLKVDRTRLSEGYLQMVERRIKTGGTTPRPNTEE